MVRPFVRSSAVIVCLVLVIEVCAEPAYQVTLGSQFTITNEDAGLDAFHKKTSAFIYNGRKVVALKSKVSDDRTSLTCDWTRTVLPGVYQLLVETVNDEDEKEVIVISEYCVVVNPRIYQVSSLDASAGDTLTIKGRFFSSRCKVYMGNDEQSLVSCKTRTSAKSIMDPETGASEVEVVVPRQIDSVSGKLLCVSSAVGTDMETIDSDLTETNAEVYVVSVGDIHETSKYISKMADFIETFRSVHTNKTVTLNAGDLLTAYSRKSYDPEWGRDLYTDDPAQHGVAMFTMVKDIPFDAIAIGNHDPCLGLSRLIELYELYPHPYNASNLYRYSNSLFEPWQKVADSTYVQPTISVHLKGIDVGIVISGSTYQDHWSNADKTDYKISNAVDQQTIANIKSCSLTNDIVILVTHQNDLSAIIPVYGNNPQPVGTYWPNSDIYSLIDLDNLAMIFGGHEHKNLFRRASYSGDNDKYALYIDKVYNPDSKLVLMKSSKFFGEYLGVNRIKWDRSTFVVDSVKLIEGKRGDDGNYLGCEEEYLFETDDDGMLQELDDSPWDPTVSTHWWRMDDWVIKEKTPVQ